MSVLKTYGPGPLVLGYTSILQTRHFYFANKMFTGVDTEIKTYFNEKHSDCWSVISLIIVYLLKEQPF